MTLFPGPVLHAPSFIIFCGVDVFAMDLDQLFVNTDYDTTTVSIPCYKKEDSGENDTEEEEVLQIELACSKAASTDYDLTGQVLWPVSVLLSHYLASRVGQELIANQVVVELGAGCGLAGLVASHFSQQVVLTDGNQVVLDLLQQNAETITKNKKKTRIISTLELVWGNKRHVQDVLDKTRNHQVDVVIAADVVQWPAVVEPLLHTVKALLWKSTQTWYSNSSKQHDNTNNESERMTTADRQPAFVLGIVNRAQSTIDLFQTLAQQLGLVVQKVEQSSFLKGGTIPPSCCEYGGRQTEIYALRLKNVNDADPPRLLMDKDDDILVGQNFGGTLFLPC